MRFGLRHVLLVFILAASDTAVVAGSQAALAEDANAFAQFPGRWIGQGRLGFKNGEVEQIKCRATYFLEKGGRGLRQNIRCASASGKVELKSELLNADGKLTGTWQELIYNLSGELEGDITKRGLRITVRGKDLTATMEVIVKEHRQIVEVHFDSATLIGMTLLLSKG